jgi:hypothetical protein
MTFAETVAITLDVDWAPEEAIHAAADTLSHLGLKATFFATHRSAVLDALDPGQFEIGWHPNFNDASVDVDTPLSNLNAVYPAARGARSHSLFVSSHVLSAYRRHGLLYEANVFLDGHPQLRPVRRFEDLVSIPFNWSDDKHLERSRPFTVDALRLDEPGLKVFNFHPIHVFMNTTSGAHYETYRPYYQDAPALGSYIAEGLGVGTLFQKLAEVLAARGTDVRRMDEIGDRCLEVT